jgi:beta-lactamase class A
MKKNLSLIILFLFILSSPVLAQQSSSQSVCTKVGTPDSPSPCQNPISEGGFSCPLKKEKPVIGCGSFMSDPKFNRGACSGPQAIDRGHCGRTYGCYAGSIEATNNSRRAHSIDVDGPAGEQVYLPTINGQEVRWVYSPASTGLSYFVDSGDGGGYGNVFVADLNGDRWVLHLLHTTPPPLTPPPAGRDYYLSGDPVTKIAATNYTHVHINIGKNPAGNNGGSGWLNPEDLGMCTGDKPAAPANIEDKVKQIFNKLPGTSTATLIMPDGKVVEKDGNKRQPSYSVIKLFVAAAAYEAVLSGQVNLTDVITVSREDVVAGTGVIQQGPFPQELTLGELIDYMLVYSDNIATNLVIKHIGNFGFVNNYLSKNGYSGTILQRYMATTSANDNYTSTQDSAMFMQKLYNKQVVDEAASNAILRMLTRRRSYEDSQFVYIGRYLPTGVDYIEKSGLGPKTRNDAGSFTTKSGQRIYLSIMLSALNNDSAGEEALSRAAQEIYNLIP